MELTKFEHSALTLSKDSATLVIDPGVFTRPLTDLANVVAIVVTHEHADHWTPDQLTALLDGNPDARILGPAGFAAAAEGFTVEVVADGDQVTVAPFDLKFFGEKHAVIHSSIPVIDNVGVLVDDSFYYGGDSYTVPPVAVETLAAPIGAPWLKIGEAMDYVLAVAPKRSFPIHDMTLSAPGKSMTQERIDWATQQGGGTFFVLEPGESAEI